MLDIEVKENFEIKNYTTFKIGGVVKKIFLPKTQAEMVYLLNNEKNCLVLGNCSNLLFSSSGYDGNIILTTQMKDFEIRGTKVIAACGVKGPILAQKTCEQSLSGFEFMIGFPGTIGGEVYMNASAHGQAISDSLVYCCLYDNEKKEILYKQKNEMEFSYRHSILQGGRYILLYAEFNLKKASQEEIKALVERNLEFRKSIQPSLVTPNAGSVFKNPQNDSAGRLLDKAGAKQLQAKNVEVWQKHANFITNKGGATSEEVLLMMYEMYKLVKDAYTIELEPEIIFVGKKNKKEEELCKILYKKIQK